MQSFISNHGYAALVVLAFIEACCIPISSEVTFGFAGVLASGALAGTHHLSLAVVILLGSLAELAGSFVSYAVGRLGGRPLIARIGRYVLITSSDLDRAERRFSGGGAVTVAVGRALPVVRAFVSIVAGTAEMPALRFGIASAIGTLVYATALASIGYAVGSAWHRVSRDFSYAGYVIVVLVVLAIAFFVVHRLRELRRERETATG